MSSPNNVPQAQPLPLHLEAFNTSSLAPSVLSRSRKATRSDTNTDNSSGALVYWRECLTKLVEDNDHYNLESDIYIVVLTPLPGT